MPSSKNTASQEQGSTHKSAPKEVNSADDRRETVREWAHDAPSPNDRGTDPNDRNHDDTSSNVLILGLKRSTHSQGTWWYYLTKPEDMTIQASLSDLKHFESTYGDIDIVHSRQLFRGYLYIRYSKKWVWSKMIPEDWRNKIWAAVERKVRDRVKEKFWESVNSGRDFSWNGEELVSDMEERSSFHLCVEIDCDSCRKPEPL